MTSSSAIYITELVKDHRKLKAQRDIIDAEIKTIKSELKDLVEAVGDKWTDDLGYARMITRKDSVAFSSVDVNRLAQTWSESNDPIMQACGKMLLDLRSYKAGYSYLQVK